MTIKLGNWQLSFGTVVSKQVPIASYRRGMNLAKWRASEALVGETQRFFSTSFGQRFLACLHAEMPCGYAHEPGMQLGRMNGFIEAIKVLEAMAEPFDKPSVELESTYGAEKMNDILMDNEPILTS